jgi:putative oxygen-independent coproporphyrinogen III oxidase
MFALYIHWPFCARRCPYCDYNAHVRERADAAGHGQALIRELRYWGERTKGRQLTSIFFGGGTPSLMPPELVQELIVTADDYWSFAADIEITLEANPTSSEAEKFNALAAAGVNRLSLGVQALDDAALKFLGRNHNRAEAVAAVELAAKIFPRYSFDLIYARPGMNVENWAAELALAKNLLRDHISLYQLSVEPNTAFATAYARGDFILPDSDICAELYDYTVATLGDAGLAPYEVSSFAKPGAECRHNLCYWEYHDYVGIGCGAHSRISFAGSAERSAAAAVATENSDSPATVGAAPRGAGYLKFSGSAERSAAAAVAAESMDLPVPRGAEYLKYAISNFKLPETWQAAVATQGHGQEYAEILSPREMALEMLLMNLRTHRGLELSRLRAETGLEFEQMVDSKFFAQAINSGLLEYNRRFLRTTAAGRAVLNDLCARLLTVD